MEKFKRISIISMVMNIIPLTMGVYYYSFLPNNVAVHFNWNGVANGFFNKTIILIGLPIFLIFLELLVILITICSIKIKELNSIKASFLLFLIPIIGILTMGTIINYNLGFAINSSQMAMLLIGVVFLLIGNYIPTVSYQFERKTHLHYHGSEKDWNKNKLFLGKTFFISGFLMLMSLLISDKISLFIMFLALAIILIHLLKDIIKKEPK